MFAALTGTVLTGAASLFQLPPGFALCIFRYSTGEMMILVVYFFSGVFLVNGVPHFVHGISGNPFQSPFASPPGIGESSPLVNVLWGAFNFIIGYVLLAYGGFFELGINLPSLVFTSGGLAIAIILAVHFGRVRNA